MAAIIQEHVQEAAQSGGLTCVIYVRVSKDRDEQASTTDQANACRAYATSQGWHVLEVVEEKGLSAYKEDVKRPEYERAIRMVESGAANVLLVWKLNRAMRKGALDFLVDLKRLRDAGGEFASVTEHVDTTSPYATMMLTMIAELARLDSFIKGEFITSWHNGRKDRERPLPPTGPRPFGYRREPNQLKIVENEAAIIREAANEILSGGNLSSIKRRLDAAGIAPTNKVGKAKSVEGFSLSGIKRVLLNPTTAGLRKVGDEYRAGVWEPIITRDEWERLTQLLTDPKRRTSDRGGRVVHLLVGIIRCASCDRPMHSRTHYKGPRYACKDCGQSIVMTQADDAVGDFITLTDRAAWQTLRMSGRGYDPAVVKAIEDEQAEIAAMHSDGVITLAQFKIMNQGLTERLAAATNDEPVELPDVDDIAAAWGTLTVEAKRLVINAMCERIVCAPTHGAFREGRERITVD